MTNARLEATHHRLPKYNTGKPCRRGHMSDRYTSNGMCIACLNTHTQARKGAAVDARAKWLQARIKGGRNIPVMSMPQDEATFFELSDILQYSSPEVTEQIHKYIHALYIASPTPRALTRDDLLTFMDFNGKEVTNYETLNLDDSDDEVLYLIHNGQRYNAVACMDVLRGKVLNVKPEPPKDNRPQWTPKP